MNKLHTIPSKWVLNYEKQRKLDKNLLTFLNRSRLHCILPKNLISAGFWAYMINCTSNRWISIGYKYQWSWPTASLISLNALVKRWTNSQTTKTIANAQNPKNTDPNTTTKLLSKWDWNKPEKKDKSEQSQSA